MDYLRLTEQEANRYVIKVFETFTDTRIKDIRCYIDNNNDLKYELHEEIIYNGKIEKGILNIDKYKYIGLLKYALMLKGYTINSVKIIQNEKKIRYKLSYDVVTRVRRKK